MFDLSAPAGACLRLLAFTLFATLFPPLSSAESAEEASAAAYREIVEASISRHILPLYDRFDLVAANLATQAGEACRTGGNLDAAGLKTAFRDTAEAWAATQHLHWGPSRAEYRYERMALGPDPKNYVGKQIRKILNKKDESVLEPERLKQKSIAVQGLTALEQLIFAASTRQVNPGFACAYGAAIARNVATMATEIAREWRDPAGYSGLMRNPSATNPIFKTDREAAAEAFKPLAGGLRFFADIRLSDPLRDSAETARPKHVEFWRSGTTNRAVSAALHSLSDLYDKGFSSQVAARSPTLDGRVKQEFARAIDLLAAVDKPFTEAVSDPSDHEKLSAATSILNDLWGAIANDVAALLGLTVGFNEFDGD